MSELTMIEQAQERSGCVPWILDEAGNRTAGFDDDRRMSEVQEGLERHRDVHPQRSDATLAEVRQTLDQLHDSSYLKALEQAPEQEAVLVEALAEPGLEPDTPVCATAVASAREGVRTSVSAAHRIVEGARFSYALCRPPGHHAGPAWLGGYCYLNNAAAAAHTLVTHLQDSGRPVAILDVDLHYPNGTAALVARMPQTTLHSLHGSTGANLPWQRVKPRSEREHLISFRSPPSADEYTQALSTTIAGISSSASAIVLSLGYDTIAEDPHGAWSLQPSIFTHVGRLMADSGLPVCIVQEGGYALGTLAQCSHAFVTGLLSGERG
jgi:acetoin utilization deacetylase AcuC-like enzyme